MPNYRPLAAVRAVSIAAAVGLSLSACAMPLPFQVASLVANGISYLTTEKTVSDHGISVVVGEDCRMLHALAGGAYCMTEDPTMDIALQAEGDAVEPLPEDEGEPGSELEAEQKPKAGPGDAAAPRNLQP